jgi:hypothetical protein
VKNHGHCKPTKADGGETMGIPNKASKEKVFLVWDYGCQSEPELVVICKTRESAEKYIADFNAANEDWYHHELKIAEEDLI